jgi:hypothetical protein
MKYVKQRMSMRSGIALYSAMAGVCGLERGEMRPGQMSVAVLAASGQVVYFG